MILGGVYLLLLISTPLTVINIDQRTTRPQLITKTENKITENRLYTENRYKFAL